MSRFNRMGLRHGFMAALLLGLVMSVSGVAQAADRIEGVENLDAVNRSRQTLSLGGREYQVTSETRIFDANGGRFRLRDLKATDGKSYNPEVHEIEFVAVRIGVSSRWKLLSVVVLGFADGE